MNGFERSHIETADGLRLQVHDRAAEIPDAPVIFLSNGLGGNLPTWRHLIRWFGKTHRIVSWDYRGLYGSELSAAQKRAKVDLRVPAHVSDAQSVMEHLELERAVLVGWSMGVQLNFELFTRVSERVEGIVAMAGGFGRVFSHTVLGRAGDHVLMPAMDVFRRAIEALGGHIGRLAEDRRLLSMAKGLGLVGRGIDEEVFRDLLREYVTLDFNIYNKILASLDEHDVEALLPEISVPVLIITGDRDPMTPKAVSQRMLEILPDAELMVIPGGTHYVPVEAPEVLNLRIEKFLRSRLKHSFGEAGR